MSKLFSDILKRTGFGGLKKDDDCSPRSPSSPCPTDEPPNSPNSFQDVEYLFSECDKGQHVLQEWNTFRSYRSRAVGETSLTVSLIFVQFTH